jgi:hypothetical protein
MGLTQCEGHVVAQASDAIGQRGVEASLALARRVDLDAGSSELTMKDQCNSALLAAPGPHECTFPG